MPAGSRQPRCAALSRLLLVFAVCAALAAPSARAAEGSANPPPSRPRIGLVLAGGGAKGVAHVGVLKVLDEMRVPVDYVVGTSMGSIVAGAYATGLTGAELERRVRDTDLEELLLDKPPRPKRSLRAKELDRANVYGVEVGAGTGGFRLPAGAIVGQNVEMFLGELAGASADVGRFDNLPIPYRAVATDIMTGEMVLLDHGDIITAMRASMAVPGIFSPVELDGRLLVDGGLVRNLPVDVARGMGAEILIVVDLGAVKRTRAELSSALGITEQMVELLINGNVRRSLSEVTERDVLITPQLGNFSSSNFREAATLIPLGERAAREKAEQLRKLALSPEAYQALRAAQMQHARRQAPAQEVRLDTTSLGFVNPAVTAAQVRTGPVQGVDRADLTDAIDTLLASDDFEQVRWKWAICSWTTMRWHAIATASSARGSTLGPTSAAPPSCGWATNGRRSGPRC